MSSQESPSNVKETDLEVDAKPSLLSQTDSEQFSNQASIPLAVNTQNPTLSDSARQDVSTLQECPSPQSDDTGFGTSNVPNFDLLESPKTPELVVSNLLSLIPDPEHSSRENRHNNDENGSNDHASNPGDQSPIDHHDVDIDAEPINPGNHIAPGNVSRIQENRTANQTHATAREPQAGAPGIANREQEHQTAGQKPETARETKRGKSAAISNEIIYERCTEKHDVVLVFDDVDDNDTFNILKEMEKIEIDGEKIDVRCFNDAIFGANKIEKAEKICDTSLLVLVVQSNKTPKDYLKFLKDEIVCQKRVEECSDGIQCLVTCEGLKKLSGLTSLDAIEWYKKDRRQTLKERIKHLRSLLWNKASLKSVDKSDGATKSGRLPRGLCLIVNNWEFPENCDVSNRPSARDQGEKLKRVFESRNFKAISYPNRTREEMEILFDEFSEDIHAEYDCFVFYVMSHGSFDKILCHKGKILEIREQWKKFLPRNCETLRDKAKVFFFCSCRMNVGVEDLARDEFSDEDPEEMKDFFFCYPCQRGCKAFKNIERDTGDIFTQEFMRVMEENNEGVGISKLMDILRERVRARPQYVGGREEYSTPELKTRSNIKLEL